MKRLLLAAAAGASLMAATVVTTEAEAQAIIGQPGRHGMHVEVEPHLILNWYGVGWGGGGYGAGWGAGVRVGIPLMTNGPIASINNSLALGLGLDALVYSWGDRWSRYGFGGAIEPVLSVNLQWNFYLFGAFSLFLEGGVAAGLGFCGSECGFWVWPGLALGGRVHFGGRADLPSLTFRFGFSWYW